MNRFIITTALGFALAASAFAEESQQAAPDEATQADVTQAEVAQAAPAEATETVDISKLSWAQKTKIRFKIGRCRDQVDAAVDFNGDPAGEAYERRENHSRLPDDVYMETKRRMAGWPEKGGKEKADDPISRMSPECQEIVRKYEPLLFPRRYR